LPVLPDHPAHHPNSWLPVCPVSSPCRASQAEAELAEAKQQADWQALRIAELQQTSGVGQLMRKYEAEVQRLRAQFDAERRTLQQQLAQATQQQLQQQMQGAVSVTVPSWAGPSPQPGMPDTAAWAELFEEPSQQLAAELQDAWAQTEGGAQQQQLVRAAGASSWRPGQTPHCWWRPAQKLSGCRKQTPACWTLRPRVRACTV
jgi:hypothetical protein